MTATILEFPPRRRLGICVVSEELATLVIRQSHGWLFGSREEGLAEARQLARRDDVGISFGHHRGDGRLSERNHPMKYDSTNRGALFRATKEKETDRDYSGSINIDGREYWLSGRVKTSAAGSKYLALSVKPKAAETAKPKGAEHTDTGIPF